MAIELRVFDVTTPAGTAKATPQVTSLAFPSRIVERIQIAVPPGPNGQLGFRLTTGGMQVLPINPGAFIISSGEVVDLTLTAQIESGAWQLTSYNTGQYNHTVQIRFYLNVVTDPQSQPPAEPIAVSVLTPLPDATPATSLDVPTLADLAAISQ